MEITVCENPQERLLLALAEKVDDNTQGITTLLKTLNQSVDGHCANPLASYMPPRGYGVAAEGHVIKLHIEDCYNAWFHVERKSMKTSIEIIFDANVDLLRANGFTVTRNDPEGKSNARSFAVAWDMHPERAKWHCRDWLTRLQQSNKH